VEFPAKRCVDDLSNQLFDISMNKNEVIAELQRVAHLFDTTSVSRSLFQKHAAMSTFVVEQTFGTWNEAVVAAGLVPHPPCGMPRDEKRRLDRVANPPVGNDLGGRIPDEELLHDLLRLAGELGRRPSSNQIAAKGKYHPTVYVRRWESVAKAYERAINQEGSATEQPISR
jgi:hypothetical protein